MGFEPTCQRLKVSYFAVKLRSLCIVYIHLILISLFNTLLLYPLLGEKGRKIILNQQIVSYYNLLMNIRVINKRTNLGKMYFENTYINTTSNAKAKTTWFTK